MIFRTLDLKMPSSLTILIGVAWVPGVHLSFLSVMVKPIGPIEKWVIGRHFRHHVGSKMVSVQWYLFHRQIASQTDTSL